MASVSTTDNGGSQPLELPVRTLAGATILVGAGSLLAALGFGLGTWAVVAAVRRWLAGLDQPPAQRAYRHVTRVRNAARVGVSAWRNGPAE